MVLIISEIREGSDGSESHFNTNAWENRARRRNDARSQHESQSRTVQKLVQFCLSAASTCNNSGQFRRGSPSIFTAIQEQLGLRLESAKVPTDLLIIDHVERPTPN
jgi:hypothetical protein